MNMQIQTAATWCQQVVKVHLHMPPSALFNPRQHWRCKTVWRTGRCLTTSLYEGCEEAALLFQWLPAHRSQSQSFAVFPLSVNFAINRFVQYVRKMSITVQNTKTYSSRSYMSMNSHWAAETRQHLFFLIEKYLKLFTNYKNSCRLIFCPSTNSFTFISPTRV